MAYLSLIDPFDFLTHVTIVQNIPTPEPNENERNVFVSLTH